MLSVNREKATSADVGNLNVFVINRKVKLAVVFSGNGFSDEIVNLG